MDRARTQLRGHPGDTPADSRSAPGRRIGPRVPPPSRSPIPPYVADVVAIQNDATTSVEQASLVIGGNNNPIRIIYGRQVIGADISAVASLATDFGDSADLVLRCTWGEGECDAIEKYFINGHEPWLGATITATHYLGTASQGIDPTLKLAIPGYADTLPGICYSVFRVPPGQSVGFPEFSVLIRGRKVSTANGGAKTYSDNPAYCIADFIENTTFGMGRSVDWTSVATAAAYSDELIGTPAEKRHIFSLVIDKPQPVESWLAVMQDSASCWVLPEGDTYRLVIDSTGIVGATKNITGITQASPMRITAVAHGFSDNDIVKVAGLTTGMPEANNVVAVINVVNADHIDLRGIDSTAFTAYVSGGTVTQIGVSTFSFNATNMVKKTFSYQKRGPTDSPTVVEVDYTNTQDFPWRTDTTDPVFIPGVYDLVPTVPFRRTRISKPGLTRYSEATRYAIELLNGGQLNDLSCQFTAFDIGVSLQAGDLIDVTHHKGLSSKICRLARAEPISPGRWAIMATEHDDEKYDSSVIAAPDGGGDGFLADPLRPPTVTGLIVTERVVIDASGKYVSKLVIKWTDASPPAGTYPFVLNYRADVYDGTTLVETATVQRSLDATVRPKYITGALPENILYTIHVTTISDLKAESPFAVATITNNGKAALPSDVKAISAFEVGGEVRITIDPATDLDLTAHEYRYGDPGSATWDTATLLDRVAAPSVRYSTKVISAGTWRIFVKGLDSVRTPAHPFGQESVNAIYTDVVVTSDANAFVAGEYDFTAASFSTSNMESHTDGAGNQYWITSDGGHWNSEFGSNLSTYTNPLYSYMCAGGGGWETEHHDFGASFSGTWAGVADFIDNGGGAVAYLDLSTVDSGYTAYSGLTAAVTARWAKMRVASSNPFIVTGLGLVRVTVVGRSESGSVTTSATVATTVSLANRYAKAVSIQLTAASGSTPRFPTYDNVVVGTGVTNSFDAYAFDAAGAKQATSCAWVFTGI